MMRFGDALLSSLRVLLGAAGIALAGVAAAVAQTTPKLPVDEEARLALIDYCVVEESRKAGQYDTYADRCKCATKAIMATMSVKDMQAVAKWRKPTTALKGRWDQAWTSCN